MPRFFPTFTGNPYKKVEGEEKRSIKKILRKEQDTASLIFVSFLLWKIWEYLRISGFQVKRYEIITTVIILLFVLAIWFLLRSWKKGWMFFKKDNADGLESI